MKYSDIKDLALQEMVKKLSELRYNLFELRMKNKLGQLGNPQEVKQVRKDIARVKTAITAKQKA